MKQNPKLSYDSNNEDSAVFKCTFKEDTEIAGT